MADATPERRTDHRCRTVLATSSEGFLVIGEDQKVRIMNEAAEGIFGIPRSDVVGKPILALGDAILAHKVDEALASGLGDDVVTFWLTEANMQLHCRMAEFEDDGVRALVVSVRDDTELFREQQRAEAILSSTGDGLVVFSLEGYVTFINPAACDMLSLEATEVVGEILALDRVLGRDAPDDAEPVTCWEARGCELTDCPNHGASDVHCWLLSGTFTEDGKPTSFRDKQETCSACEVYQMNCRALGEYGTWGRHEFVLEEPVQRVLSVKCNPVIDDSGSFGGCVTTISDITVEREISQMKTEFVSTVSHELRTPLTSIKGYVDLILDGEAGDINETQQEFLGIVKENSDRLVGLINDLLDISRIESGRVHLKVEPLDLGDTIADAVGTFRAVVDLTGHVLDVSAPEDLPRAAGDRDRVGQVLANLISNAIKYSPDGGTVRIAARQEIGEVVVGVTDSGIGISPEDQTQLFSKFFRVDSSFTQEIGGTGLGLSICKSIIELLGGRIWVTSELGQGSTFNFSLPIASGRVVRTPGIEGPLDVQHGRVLVVDREKQVANLIERFLTRRGHMVIKAHTAAEAKRLAIEEEPDVITLDVMLDDMDGFSLLRELGSNPATSAIPVVILSIVCDEGRSCRLGAANYLEKPIDQERLVSVIDSLVGSLDAPLVLVVDDDADIVDSLSRNLKSRGFAVSAAYDGREALASIDTNRPDIVLLDLKMPEVDGYQVIQTVKKNDATKEIPIVVMTAHSIDKDKVDILELAAEQVVKPFEVEYLVEKVESFLTKGP